MAACSRFTVHSSLIAAYCSELSLARFPLPRLVCPCPYPLGRPAGGSDRFPPIPPGHDSHQASPGPAPSPVPGPAILTFFSVPVVTPVPGPGMPTFFPVPAAAPFPVQAPR